MISFIKNRPPLIIFLICILTTAITMFYFAYSIKTSELVVDSDKVNEWRDLLNHFNKLEGCLPQNDKVIENIDTLISVQTLVSINLSDVKQYSSVHGYLSLKEWHATCPKHNPKPDYMEIYFNIPKTDKLAAVDICVNIKGPEEYLPKILKPNCLEDVQTFNEDSQEIYRTTFKYKNEKPFCKKGILTNIEFHPQKIDNLSNFLSSGEKNLIYVHLLWTSCLLIFVVFLIVIFNSLYNNNQLDGYIKKCTEFIHNR